MKRITIALIALATAGVSCGQEAPAPARTTDPPAEIPVKAPGKVAPTMKATAASKSGKLGSLPAGVGIPVGEGAPDAQVVDFEGRAVRLGDFWSKGPMLLVFYRGGWCPFCNFQIRNLTAAFSEFKARGVTPVAISADKTEEAAKTKATYDIPFPVLSDPDLVAHRAFRVIHHADEAEVARLKGFGIDLERSSGRDHHVFAIPALFAIDKDGGVRWAHADPDYKVRPTTRQLLDVLDGLGWRP